MERKEGNGKCDKMAMERNKKDHAGRQQCQVATERWQRRPELAYRRRGRWGQHHGVKRGGVELLK